MVGASFMMRRRGKTLGIDGAALHNIGWCDEANMTPDKKSATRVYFELRQMK